MLKLRADLIKHNTEVLFDAQMVKKKVTRNSTAKSFASQWIWFGCKSGVTKVWRNCSVMLLG